MRRLFRSIGTAFLFIAVAICFAPSLIPPFLDRIYYDGPASDHFDGERFFNPGFGHYRGGDPRAFFNRWARGEERAQWPAQVSVRPSAPAPRVQGDDMQVTWIGHATVLIQSQGINILTDPIWSERASPFAAFGPKRVREPGVRFDDLPRIDLVLISHNHYDHMDLPTLRRLWKRDRPLIVTSLGNDSVMAKAGVPALALDWGESQYVAPACVEIASAEGVAAYPDLVARMECSKPGATVSVERNHHWSSRWGTDRNRALWSAFTVKLPGGNIFFAGDTGWGDGSWVKQAAAQGPYRLAVIPIGAYEPRDFMKTNHINPEEAVRIFDALRPAAGLGVHWGTFQLTFEGIDDPRRRLEALKKAGDGKRGGFITTEVGQSFAVPSVR